jgi:hypothetical protein
MTSWNDGQALDCAELHHIGRLPIVQGNKIDGE